MRILIILPNWLGDAVMATPAIELLSKQYYDPKFTFIGSAVSISALKHHPFCEEAIVDSTKKESNRLIATYKLAKKLGEFDLAVSFRNQIYTSILLRLTNTVIIQNRESWHALLLLSHPVKTQKNTHLVQQYTQIAMVNNDEFDNNIPALQLYIKPQKFENKTLGINPGATYGSAKRWYPEKFAQVAASFSNQFDIVIFGGPNEIDMAQEIEQNLIKLKVNNFTNMAGRTTVEELCSHIGGCDLFLTNDSGPMHVAAAYQVPTVSIFGPTKYKETSQWMNAKSSIVHHEIECSPCMKRECPLVHHECMKGITALEVVAAAKKLIS